MNATIPPLLIVEAAIQVLHKLVQERGAQIDELRSKQAAMEMQLVELTLRLEDQTANPSGETSLGF